MADKKIRQELSKTGGFFFYNLFLEKGLTNMQTGAILTVTVIITDRSRYELQEHGTEK